MKTRFIFSLLLLTTCIFAFSPENLQVKPDKKKTAMSEKGLIKIAVMYPYAEGKTFDMEYYEAKHMPMVAAWLGSNLVKYTIDKGMKSGDQPLLYMAVGTFYVKSQKEYDKAIAPNIDAIIKDIPKYTNINPVFLVSEVIK